MLETLQKKNVQLADQIVLLERLANLMKNGYSLSRALSLLSFDPRLGTLAKQIEGQLKIGKSLDQIFQHLGFSQVVISFIFFSQATGRLQESLHNACKLLKQQKEFQSKFNKVLQYPMILFCFLILLFFFLKLFLLPSLMDVYQGFQNGMNSTPMLFNFLNSLINFLLILISLIVMIIFVWKKLNSKLSVQNKLKIFQRIPFLKSYKSIETSYLFSYHFSTLLISGLSIKNALQIMSEQDHLPFIQHYASLCYEAIYSGEKLNKAILSFPLMENELSIIIERSMYDGTLEKDLYSYAEMLVDSLVVKINKVITYIQPACYLFFGLIILSIYFSILIPMFNLMQQL